MLPVANDFDVYVTASGSDAARMATLSRLTQLYKLDGARQRSFLEGERVMLRERISDGEAKKLATDLRTLGLRVDIEAHRSSGLAMVELDSFTTDEPRAADIAPTNLLFDVGAGLVGLDGSDEDLPSAHQAPAPKAASSKPQTDSLLGGLMGISLSDEDAPLSQEPSARPAAPSARSGMPSLPPARSAPPVPPVAARPAPPELSPVQAMPPAPAARPAPPIAVAKPASDRFAPTGGDHGSLNLDLDVVPPDPMLSRPAVKQDAFEVPRCPTHDIPKVRGGCPRCDAEENEVRGRLFAGKLRRNPAMRVGIGVAAGVAIGWIITMPMVRKGERAVQYIRDEADRERARPTEEAQAHARQLDTQADEEAQSAFFRTLGVWAVIVAATTGVWYRLT